MNGPRILLGVVLLGALALWAALAGGPDADLERGRAQTDEAFARIEAELLALQPDAEWLRSQGLILGLREEHDTVRTQLATLRDERVAVELDATLDRRQRLPALRALVERADLTLAAAIELRRRLAGLVELRRGAEPLRERAARLRAQADAPAAAGGPQAARLGALLSGLAAQEEQLALAERLVRDNPSQGTTLGRRALSGMAGVLDELQAELAR